MGQVLLPPPGGGSSGLPTPSVPDARKALTVSGDGSSFVLDGYPTSTAADSTGFYTQPTVPGDNTGLNGAFYSWALNDTANGLIEVGTPAIYLQVNQPGVYALVGSMSRPDQVRMGADESIDAEIHLTSVAAANLALQLSPLRVAIAFATQIYYLPANAVGDHFCQLSVTSTGLTADVPLTVELDVTLLKAAAA